MSTVVSCPSCTQPLPPSVASCFACGLPLTGDRAAALWQVDLQIAALRVRREQLLSGLRHPDDRRTSETSWSEQGTLRLSAAPDRSVVPAGAADADGEPVRRRETWHGQQILLAAGALLVLVAAVVFLAVTWSVIGVNGQVTVMGLVTILAGAASLRTRRRGLGATAEALAVITVGLAVVDIAAAQALNLVGLAHVDPTRYGAVAAAVLALAITALASRSLTIHSYPVAAVLSAAAAPALLLVGLDSGPAVTSLVCLLAAGIFAALLLGLPSTWSPAWAPLVVAAAGYLVTCLLVALPQVFVGDLTGSGGACAVVALVAATAVGWVSQVYRGLTTAAEHPLLAGTAVVALVAIITGLGWHADPTAVLGCVVAAAAAVNAGWVAWRSRGLRTHPLGVLALVLQLVAAAGLVGAGVADRADVDRHSAGWTALVIALVATAVSAAATARRQPAVRTVAGGYAAALSLLAAHTAGWPSGPVATTVAVTLTAVLVAAAAGRLRDQPLELVLAIVAGLGTLAAALTSLDGGAPLLAFVLAAGGLTALGYGVLPGRGWVALLGVAGCSTATWVLLLDSGVSIVEAYSLPLALLIAIVGFVRLHRDPDAPSWLTLGPGLAAAMLPSAVASIADDNLARPLLVLAVSAVVLVVGVMTRWQSPVVVGSVAITVVAVAQLAPYAVGLPRWLTFGTLGIVLLVLGARYEQRRRNASQAAHWIAALR